MIPSLKAGLFAWLLLMIIISCNSTHTHVGEKEVVQKAEEINSRAEEIIQGTLKDMLQNNRELNDSFKVKNAFILQFLYDQNSFQPLWSSKGIFNKNADSLLNFIDHSKEYGLFPDDYYFEKLESLKNQLISDTSSREKKLDASLWAYNDILFTAAFVQIVRDLKAGRLLPDSILNKDSSLSGPAILQQLERFKNISNNEFAQNLEPKNHDYVKLRNALREFLPKAHFRPYTYINTKDSIFLRQNIYKRLKEDDSEIVSSGPVDSSGFIISLKKYQHAKGLKPDGKVTPSLIAWLNNNDDEKFIRIAITLDRYKQMEPLPDQYIWVNLPSYYLQLRVNDSVIIKSRIVIGKPLTRTPIITSAINNMVTYPQWHIPESIIKKEVLPGLKKDAGYTIKKGLSLIDKDNNEVDPYSVDWSRYKELIPYNVIQGSGDENALGVLKFNFPNKYSVYLHDTNQRYLFSKSARALSHGCVRVQAWEKLAIFILRNDSTYSFNALPVDSMNKWLRLKEKHYIPVRKPVPLFIRYFTVDVNDSNIIYYDDVYGEDKKIRDRLFNHKF